MTSLGTWTLFVKRTTKHRTLRFTLTMIMTALIIAVSLSILAISYSGSARSLLVLSENMTAEISNGIIEKINSLMNSAEQANAVVNLMITQGILDPTDGSALWMWPRLVSQSRASRPWNQSPRQVEVQGERRLTAASSALRRQDDYGRHRTYYYENPDFPNQRQNSVKSLRRLRRAEGPGSSRRSIPARRSDGRIRAGTLKQFVYSASRRSTARTTPPAVAASTSADDPVSIPRHSQDSRPRQSLCHERSRSGHCRPIKSVEELAGFRPALKGARSPTSSSPSRLPDPDIRWLSCRTAVMAVL
jgi:hypothetical protein